MPTEVINSVGSSGDYTTLEAWRDAQARDLVAADEIAVAEIYDDFGAAGLACNDFNPSHPAWVTDEAHPIVIRAADSAYRFGNKSDGARLHVVDGSAVLLLDEVDQRVEFCGLTIMAVAAYDRAVKIQNNGLSFGVRFRRCAITSNAHYTIYAANVQTVGLVRFEACLIEQVDRTKELVYGIKSLPFEFINTVLYGGLQVDASTSSLTNVLAQNTVAVGQAKTPSWNARAILAFGSTNNATSYGDVYQPPGVDPLRADITDDDFVDIGSGDIHLSADSQLVGTGANLAEHYPDLVDIDLITWPPVGPWDIGADAVGNVSFVKPPKSRTKRVRAENRVVTA